ncbi:CHCH domain containing protein [Musa troglodytarum]|uniref:CHCH domain containing protein n=1 Tax=Musa troglodytarum TaxID=320322 RepID=A0A9E7FC97_9LILI|nr:CHCH domain containing protein [Musa troglodytarum]
MEAVTPQAVCAREALALLNCTVETPFDRDKCLRLLDALRSCVLEKKVKKFSVAEQSHAARMKPSEGKTEGSKASKRSRKRATREKVERFRRDRGLGDPSASAEQIVFQQIEALP